MELSKIAENDETMNEGVFGGFFVIQKTDRGYLVVPSYYITRGKPTRFMPSPIPAP